MSTAYYLKTVKEICEEMNSRETGLSVSEAEIRFREAGPNELPEPKVPGLFFIFLSQFLSPLIYILFVAAALVIYMGEVGDGIIIFFVLFFNAIIGTIQEGKAQNTLLALRTFIKGSATVLRDDKVIILPDREVVPGDVILLQEGEKVPADARIFISESLRVDEAALTGESVPVSKITKELEGENLSAHDQRNMVFRGTHVVGGSGRAIVIGTGLQTEIGKISQAIASIDADLPLKKNITYLSKAIIGVVFAIASVIFAFGLYRGEPVIHIFATVVSLAISLIPEGLPIVVTIVLATGVWRMSRQHVLVKKLQAVEGLGQARVIAVDKTGTLTKNEMTVERVFIDNHIYEVSGLGYEPRGMINKDGENVDPLNHPDLIVAGRVAGFCANATAMYVEKEGIWKVAGDPTEAALGVFAEKAGCKKSEEDIKIFELPFDYLAKYHLSIHSFNKKNFLSIIGAPEKILSLSTRVWKEKKSSVLDEKEKEKLESVFYDFSRNGYRVLAFGFNQDAPPSVENGNLPPIIFGGFFGIKDALRPEVGAAVQRAKEAGIRVVMITGDHAVTAHAIAKEAGIASDESGVITGDELENLSEEELIKRFAASNVFARVSPQQKFKIIDVFKKRGEIVAMTGDGVNDAPSLAEADLGVAMGKIGTEVAKEASDLVLLDDNFGNIISAVEEGRSIYKTMRKVILYLLAGSWSQVLTLLGSLFLDMPLPLLPAQIIWLNFVTDGFLDIALAMEPKEEGLLRGNFKKPKKYLVDVEMVARALFMAVPLAIGTLILFNFHYENDITKALTISLTALAVGHWFNAWNSKSDRKSLFLTNPFNNLYLVGATVIVITIQLLAVYHPFLQEFLHTTALTSRDWSYIFSIGFGLLILEELRKFIFSLWRRH